MRLICSEWVNNSKYPFLHLQTSRIRPIATITTLSSQNQQFYWHCPCISWKLFSTDKFVDGIQQSRWRHNIYPSNLRGYHWGQKSALNLTCNQELATPSQDLCELLAHNYKFCSSEDATSPVLHPRFGACQTCDNSPHSPMH